MQSLHVSLNDETLHEPLRAPADALRAAVHKDLHRGPRQGVRIAAAAPHRLRVERYHRRGEVALVM